MLSKAGNSSISFSVLNYATQGPKLCDNYSKPCFCILILTLFYANNQVHQFTNCLCILLTLEVPSVISLTFLSNDSESLRFTYPPGHCIQNQSTAQVVSMMNLLAKSHQYVKQLKNLFSAI